MLNVPKKANDALHQSMLDGYEVYYITYLPGCISLNIINCNYSSSIAECIQFSFYSDLRM